MSDNESSSTGSTESDSDASLDAFTESCGTTDNPRDHLDDSRMSRTQVASRLEDYEDAFPGNTFAEVSLALTGHESISDTLSEIDTILAGEKDAGLDDDARETLASARELLEAVEGRLVETFGMRQFDSKQGKSPVEINKDAVEGDSKFSLLNYNASIAGESQVAVYDRVSNDGYAVVMNREKHRSVGPFEVKDGKYHGGFDVHFTSDPDSFIENEFYPDGWRRARDVVSADDEDAAGEGAAESSTDAQTA